MRNVMTIHPFLSRAQTALAVAAVLALAAAARAEDDHKHTHIARNADQTWGTDDDDVLWLFSSPAEPTFPGWPVLEMERKDAFPWDGKYVCEELYCWHSAHPPHGNWQLGGSDPNVTPEWRIALERVHFDLGFHMCTYDTLDPVLTADGDRYVFDPAHGMQWSDDHYSENQTKGAWRFGHHLHFYADADTPLGETLTATFRAVDVRTGGTPFATSEDYTISFVTTPEPSAMALVAAGGLGLALVRRRKRERACRS